MSEDDHPENDSSAVQHLIPLPPDPGWFGGLSNAWKNGISAIEATFAFGFASAAWTVGAETSLRWIALVAGWVIASTAFMTVADRSMRWRLSAIILSLIPFVSEGAFLTWHFASTGTPVLDNTVQFKCEWSQPPTVVPQHTLFEFQINSAFLSGPALVSSSKQPGSPIDMTSADAPDYFVRCHFDNLGQHSLFNVTTELTFTLRETEPNGQLTGKVISTHTVLSPPANLGTGKSFEFYVRNYSPTAGAALTWPANANGQIVGSEKASSFRLIANQISYVGLPAFVPKPVKPDAAPSPPVAQPSPTPSPTSPPTGQAFSPSKSPTDFGAPKPAPTPRPRPSTAVREDDNNSKQNRALIAYNASELTGLFNGGAKLDVFLKRWMKIEGVIIGVPSTDKIDGKDYLSIGIRDGVATVVAYFDAKKYGDQLLSLKAGAGVGVICQFAGVQTIQQDGGSLVVVVVTYCEAPPPSQKEAAH